MAETVGRKIRRLRQEAGMKQGELAREAGIPQSTLSDIEHGRTNVPGGRIALKLARALHVHPDVLLSEGGDDVRYGQPTPEEVELLGLYSVLDAKHRTILLATARAMADLEPPEDRAPHDTRRAQPGPRKPS